MILKIDYKVKNVGIIGLKVCTDHTLEVRPGDPVSPRLRDHQLHQPHLPHSLHPRCLRGKSNIQTLSML